MRNRESVSDSRHSQNSEPFPEVILRACRHAAQRPTFSSIHYINAMSDVTCVRCGKTAPRIAGLTLPGELGQRILDTICADCWTLWKRQQTQVINHYGLDLRDPKARQMLTQQTETFLFGAEKS